MLQSVTIRPKHSLRQGGHSKKKRLLHVRGGNDDGRWLSRDEAGGTRDGVKVAGWKQFWVEHAGPRKADWEVMILKNKAQEAQVKNWKMNNAEHTRLQYYRQVTADEWMETRSRYFSQ